MEFYTAKEVQTMLRIGNRKLYKLLKQRDFPSFMIDGTWRIKKAEFDSWTDKQCRKK